MRWFLDRPTGPCHGHGGHGIWWRGAASVALGNDDAAVPAVAVVATAAGFVGVLSLANMGGRIGWSTLSDAIGRKTIFCLFVRVGVVACLTLAPVGATSIAVFVGVTFLIVSFYGGGFSTIPAYLRDLFGQRDAGVILGIVLTAWSAAGIVGPLIMNSLVDSRGERHFRRCCLRPLAVDLWWVATAGARRRVNGAQGLAASL